MSMCDSEINTDVLRNLAECLGRLNKPRFPIRKGEINLCMNHFWQKSYLYSFDEISRGAVTSLSSFIEIIH